MQVNKVNEPNDSTGGTYISADYLFPLSRAEFNDVPTGDVEEEGQKPYLYYTQQQTTEHSQSPLRIKNYIGTDTPFNY
ncbi:MAG: hypothetical protein MJ233_02650 [Mycoplasmoidaceae bacterium]|nr:hypothetical protein [Mycoplasmoidaceae bacterium]